MCNMRRIGHHICCISAQGHYKSRHRSIRSSVHIVQQQVRKYQTTNINNIRTVPGIWRDLRSNAPNASNTVDHLAMGKMRMCGSANAMSGNMWACV